MTPKQIAERLTEAQQRAVSGAYNAGGGMWLYRLGSARGMIPLGLGVRTIDGVALTQAAFAVRAVLMEEPKP